MTAEGRWLEALQETALYESLTSWPGWLSYLAVLLFFGTVAAISESYRAFVRKLLSVVWSRLKRLSPKSIVSGVRETLRVRRVRKRGRLEAGERMSRAEEILPFLNGPDAEKVLRRHAAALADSFMDTRKFHLGSQFLFDVEDMDHYMMLKEAEFHVNPMERAQDKLWLLDDESVIVEGADRSMQIGSTEQAEWARQAFGAALEHHLGRR